MGNLKTFNLHVKTYFHATGKPWHRDTIEKSILKTHDIQWHFKAPEKKMLQTNHTKNSYKRHDKYSASTSVQECIPTEVFIQSLIDTKNLLEL